MTTLPNSLKSDNLVYYTLVDNINYVLGYCIIQANSKFKIHYHNIDEMYVILDGEGEIYNHTEWVKIKKGESINFKPYTNHCCRTNSRIVLAYMFFKGPFNKIKYYSKL